MPVPKKGHSHQRQQTRRANWKITPAETTLCPACGAPVLPYNVCEGCGQYQGRQYLKIKDKEKKSKKEK
jgi:large subunit ribosomal protein L32